MQSFRLRTLGHFNFYANCGKIIVLKISDMVYRHEITWLWLGFKDRAPNTLLNVAAACRRIALSTAYTAHVFGRKWGPQSHRQTPTSMVLLARCTRPGYVEAGQSKLLLSLNPKP